jgi:hypothetical protein
MNQHKNNHLLLNSLLFLCLTFTQLAWAKDGNGSVKLAGELKQWHAVQLDLEGPFARELDTNPNPFTDYRYNVTFEHESGTPKYIVPGYFAADGNAAQSGADSGNVWRAMLSPDKPGQWSWRISFVAGEGVATSDATGTPLSAYDGKQGTFQISASDKSGRDFRGKGRLQYVGGHHLQFAGSKEYFLKAGPDAPETLLAYSDFDNTVSYKPEKVPLKTWAPHIQDWQSGDPSWHGEKGKGLIGAVNYLASEGLNSMSFIPYNAGGDGDNVWPFVERDSKFHYDTSKLAQWNIVFSHAQQQGIYLHFKLQETENDDLRFKRERSPIDMPPALDAGKTGPERKLYLREMVARFGHHLALNWNLGEESTMTSEEQIAMARYLESIDPYHHLMVIHSYPNEQEIVYEPLLGDKSPLTGASLQNSWDDTHMRTVQWIERSAQAGRPWVAANDEQGPADIGAPPDPGYKGFNGTATQKDGKTYDLHDIRKYTLWGNLMAGGAGVEYYFGYRMAENDLVAEDFRSRDKSWDYCRHALEFFSAHNIPFWEMSNADELVGNPEHDNSVYALAKENEVYLVYLPRGGEAMIDLSMVSGKFHLEWFNPREGGELQSAGKLNAGKKIELSAPSQEDWLALIRK